MLHVLIADDDAAARGALVTLVASLGYAVRDAQDGAEALRLHEEMPADIVLTDWEMPALTGLELCVRVKEAASPPYVILMTAFEGRARLVEGLRAGADDFVRKPVDFDELEVRLLAASRMVNALQMLAAQNARLRRTSERSFAAARVDALTGIGNRLALDEAIARLSTAALRYGRRASLALCDIDFFKQYNDRFGHVAGDEALRRVAHEINAALRSSDGVFRYGGDELLVLLPEQSLGEAAIAMERVRAVVQALGIEHQVIAPDGVLTISVGVAEHGDDAATWIERADAALYAAKNAGRNRVCAP